MEKFLSKYHNYLLITALILSSIAISIRGGDGKITLLLHNYPAIIFLMVVISLFLVAVYFQINSKKISSLSNQIREQSKIKNEGTEFLLGELSKKQKDVYNLIISGKTNKEIMTVLFIEQSTLKSHINQIYKKLNIKSRSELKSNVKPG